MPKLGSPIIIEAGAARLGPGVVREGEVLVGGPVAAWSTVTLTVRRRVPMRSRSVPRERTPAWSTRSPRSSVGDRPLRGTDLAGGRRARSGAGPDDISGGIPTGDEVFALRAERLSLEPEALYTVNLTSGTALSFRRLDLPPASR